MALPKGLDLVLQLCRKFEVDCRRRSLQSGDNRHRFEASIHLRSDLSAEIQHLIPSYNLFPVRVAFKVDVVRILDCHGGMCSLSRTILPEQVDLIPRDGVGELSNP